MKRSAVRTHAGTGAFVAPDGLEAEWVEREGQAFVVFSWPRAAPATLAGLTAAEQEVVALLLDGLSNAAIGLRRGTSQRTVANQVASIFRKLGVSSRHELAAAVARSPRSRRR